MTLVEIKKASHYHIILGTPLLVVLFLFNFDYVSVEWIMLYGILDVFLYRPIVNKKRLESLGVFERASYLKRVFVVPFKYYSQLMFKSI